MKKLSIILLISIFFACSKEETKPIIKGDVNGSWLNISIRKQGNHIDTPFFINYINIKDKKFTLSYGYNFNDVNYKSPIILTTKNFQLDSISNGIIYFKDSIYPTINQYKNYYLENNNDSIYFYESKSYGSVRIN